MLLHSHAWPGAPDEGGQADGHEEGPTPFGLPQADAGDEEVSTQSAVRLAMARWCSGVRVSLSDFLFAVVCSFVPGARPGAPFPPQKQADVPLAQQPRPPPRDWSGACDPAGLSCAAHRNALFW